MQPDKLRPMFDQHLLSLSNHISTNTQRHTPHFKLKDLNCTIRYHSAVVSVCPAKRTWRCDTFFSLCTSTHLNQTSVSLSSSACLPSLTSLWLDTSFFIFLSAATHTFFVDTVAHMHTHTHLPLFTFFVFIFYFLITFYNTAQHAPNLLKQPFLAATFVTDTPTHIQTQICFFTRKHNTQTNDLSRWWLWGENQTHTQKLLAHKKAPNEFRGRQVGVSVCVLWLLLLLLLVGWSGALGNYLQTHYFDLCCWLNVDCHTKT